MRNRVVFDLQKPAAGFFYEEVLPLEIKAPERRGWAFCKLGLGYYISGRFAAINSMAPLAGHHFHHAFELLLKGCLLKRGKPWKEVKDLDHNLMKVWEHFRKLETATEFGKVEPTIRDLAKFERRYPSMEPGVRQFQISLMPLPIKMGTHTVTVVPLDWLAVVLFMKLNLGEPMWPCGKRAIEYLLEENPYREVWLKVKTVQAALAMPG